MLVPWMKLHRVHPMKHSVFLAFLLFPVFLAAWGVVVCLSASPADARKGQDAQAVIEVDVGRDLGRVDPLLFGQNIYAMSNAIALWDTSTNNMDSRAAQLVKAVAPTILRFPGGSEADKYLWEDGLGSKTVAAVQSNATSIVLSSPVNWGTVKHARFVDSKWGQFGDQFRLAKASGLVIEGVSGLNAGHGAGTDVRPESREGQAEESFNNFGTDEFMKLLKILGAQGLVTINYGTGMDKTGKVTSNVSMAQRICRATAWVAYLNGKPTDTRSIGIDGEGNDWKTIGYWAGLRGQRGHPEPFEVKYWEIGNETYGDWEAGFASAGKYASDFLLFVRMMKGVDPSIKVGAVGLAHPYGPNGRGDADRTDPWNVTVLKAAGDSMDFFVLHSYYPCAKPEESPYGSPQWNTGIMAAATQAMADIREVRSLINTHAKAGSKIEIAVDEYGIMPFKSKDPKDYSTLGGALFNADLLMELIRHGRELGINMANVWDLQSHDQLASIRYDWSTGTRVVRPHYYSLQLIRSRLGPDLCGIEVHPPTFSTEKVGNVARQESIPVLSSLAGRDANGGLTLLVLNRDQSSSISTNIQLKGFHPGEEANAWTLNANSLGDHNEDIPTTVKLSEERVSSVTPSFTYSFPKHSLTLLELKSADTWPIQ